MGYLHIDNLYKNQDVLMFKELYAMEKIHGTSAHILYKDKKVHYFSGGAKYEHFVGLFDEQSLYTKFDDMGRDKIVIYGEAYGGKMQGMSGTYGKEMKFVVFDVKIDDYWLSVPQAEEVAKTFGLEFVHYVKIPADIESINRERDADSVQAIRNGMGEGKKREGIVLRPLVDWRKNNNQRVIAKHKREDFSETKTKREVSPERLKVLEEANEIAEEWVTEMRLTHVLDKLPHGINVESTGMVIKAMVEDVLREANGEIVDTKDARKAIGKRAAALFKERIKGELK